MSRMNVGPQLSWKGLCKIIYLYYVNNSCVHVINLIYKFILPYAFGFSVIVLAQLYLKEKYTIAYQCKKRDKFHEPPKRRDKFSCPRNRYFSQIALTNRIYLFNSAEYLTASKTVACKHHCRLEPRNLSMFFFFTIQISSVKFKITADNVVCHFSFLYRWLEEEIRVIRNYIRDVINYLKKGFSHERGICLVPWYLLRQIPRYTEFRRTNTPPMGKSEEKTKNW